MPGASAAPKKTRVKKLERGLSMSNGHVTASFVVRLNKRYPVNELIRAHSVSVATFRPGRGGVIKLEAELCGLDFFYQLGLPRDTGIIFSR